MPSLGVLTLVLVLASPASAAPACEEATEAADRTIAAGSCLRLGPGATVSGPLLVDGTLLLEGSAEAPVLVTAPITLRGEPATVSRAAFSGLGQLLTAGGDGRRVDLTVADTAFDVPAGGRGLYLTDGFRAEVARSTFSGAGTGIDAQFAGPASSLAVIDSSFLGPGPGVVATMGPAGGQRLALSGNTFAGQGGTVESFVGEMGLVTIRGGPEGAGKAPIITLSANTFRDATVGLALEASNYRLLSTDDVFRSNAAGVVVSTEGRSAIFDRATFEDNRKYDLVLPSTGDATVKDPVKFDPKKVFVTQGSQVTLQQGKSKMAITYDYMVENRGAVAAGGAALALLGFSLSASARALLAKSLFVPLYARLSPEQVLNHEKRQEILAYVQANPGVHLRRIGHELSISYGTLTYHLYRLEREGYITWSQEGLFKRFYSSAGRMKEAAKGKPMPTALRDLERRIYDTILANPGSAQSHLAQMMGLSRQALHYHIKKLEKSGFITKVPQGRETLIYAAQPEGDAAAVANT